MNFPGATSIWAGLKKAVTDAVGTATLRPDDRYARKPAVAVVVFGETPHAAFQGDLKMLRLRPELRTPIGTMRRLKAEGVPIVAVMLTARPLFAGPELNLADASVVAWLPGSEVAGGKPLFPLIYALGGRSASAERWTPVPEDAGVGEADASGVSLSDGAPAAGWSLHVSDGAAGVSLKVPAGSGFATLGVPLKCLGSGLAAVQTPFAIRSAKAMRFSLARVALGKTADRVLASPAGGGAR